MKLREPSEKQARAYAKKHGYRLRRIPYSTDWPNGYVKITEQATGVTFRAAGWQDAIDEMAARMKYIK